MNVQHEINQIRAEHANRKQFALDHQTCFVNHKSQHTGETTLRQWSFHHGNRKCLLTRFPREDGWTAALWETHMEDKQTFRTKGAALLFIGDWLQGARV